MTEGVPTPGVQQDAVDRRRARWVWLAATLLGGAIVLVVLARRSRLPAHGAEPAATVDPAVTLVELLAAVGDRLSYDQERLAAEGYLDTARQRVAVRRHPRPGVQGCGPTNRGRRHPVLSGG